MCVSLNSDIRDVSVGSNLSDIAFADRRGQQCEADAQLGPVGEDKQQ